MFAHAVFTHARCAWGKKPLEASLVEQRHGIVRCFLNRKPGRIDHDEYKYSNFDEERQPEIAIWEYEPEVGPKI